MLLSQSIVSRNLKTSEAGVQIRLITEERCTLCCELLGSERPDQSARTTSKLFIRPTRARSHIIAKRAQKPKTTSTQTASPENSECPNGESGLEVSEPYYPNTVTTDGGIS